MLSSRMRLVVTAMIVVMIAVIIMVTNGAGDADKMSVLSRSSGKNSVHKTITIA